MRRIAVNPKKPRRSALEAAAKVLAEGGVVVLPTETVYGIACDAFNEAAAERVFKAKGRRKGNPLPVLVAARTHLARLVRHVPVVARPLMRRFWPGPLTLVMDAHPDVPLIVTAARGCVGVRLPDHPIATSLARRVGPLACTSANYSGENAAKSPDELDPRLLKHVDLVLDAGRTRIGVASSVLDLTGSAPRLLREGTVTARMMERAAGIRVEK